MADAVMTMFVRVCELVLLLGAPIFFVFYLVAYLNDATSENAD